MAGKKGKRKLSGGDGIFPKVIKTRKRRAGSNQHSGMTLELLKQLLAANKLSAPLARRLKILSDEQIGWIVESDGNVTPEQLNTLLRDYSVRADGESEKCTGTHSYAWNKVVSAVLVDCADRVLEKKGLTEEEEERELFQNMRTSLVAETASRLIKEGKLTVANVDGGRLQTGRERSLAYVKTNTIVDRKMNALEAWYIASSFRLGSLSSGSISLYAQTAKYLTSVEPSDIDTIRQKVSKEWMKDICCRFPDQLQHINIQETQKEFSVGLSERVWLGDDGVWWLSQKEGEATKAQPGLVIAAILQHHKEDVTQIGGRTLCTVLRTAHMLREGVMQQFRLHKSYRAAGNTMPPPWDPPQLPEARNENDGDAKVEMISPDEALELTRSIMEKCRMRLEKMPVWCLQHEVMEILDKELQLVRMSKRDLCGFHPLFKENGVLGMLFIGNMEDLNAKFDRQSVVFGKFLANWRKTMIGIMGEVNEGGKRAKGAGKVKQENRDREAEEAAGLLETFRTGGRASPEPEGPAEVVCLGAWKVEIEKQVSLIRSQMIERMEQLSSLHLEQVEQLRAVVEQQIAGLQDSFDAQVQGVRAQADAQVAQLRRLIQTLAGK